MRDKLIFVLYLLGAAGALWASAPFMPWPRAPHFAAGAILLFLEIIWAPRRSPIQAVYWLCDWRHRREMRRLEERERRYGRVVWIDEDKLFQRHFRKE